MSASLHLNASTNQSYVAFDQSSVWAIAAATSAVLGTSVLTSASISVIRAFLERAALEYIGNRVKSERDARDAAILDRVADELNQQSDVLEFQGMPKGLSKGSPK